MKISSILLHIKNKRRRKSRQVFLLLLKHMSMLRNIMTYYNKKSRIWRHPELCPNLKHPSIGTVPGHYEMVVPLMDDERFRKYYRISRNIFTHICNILTPVLNKRESNYRPSICVGKKVLISIHVLKSNCNAQSIASIYKVGKSTVTSIVKQFCKAMTRTLYKTSVQFPHTEEEKQDIASRFLEKWQFPLTFGSLDGTHIQIKKPKVQDVDYFNYKKYYSIVLLALVDDNYMFRYVNIGRPGGCHDATVFKDSLLYEKLQNQQSKYHIIADGAFPISKFLMKPYQGISGSNLTIKQQHFNFRLSRARMTVENAFGRFKGRWRINMKCNDYSIETVKLMVKTCIILHNLCEERKEPFIPEWRIENHDIPQPNSRDMGAFVIDGKSRRDFIAREMLN